MFAALEMGWFIYFYISVYCEKNLLHLGTIFRGHWNIFQEWKYFAIDILYELDKNSICCVHQNKTFLFGNLANGLSWPVAGDFIEQWNLVESLHFCPAFSLIHKLRHFMPFFLIFFSKQRRVGLQHYFKVTFVHSYAFPRFFCLRVLEWNQCCGM